MYIEESSIDDIMYKVFSMLLERGDNIVSSKGNNREVLGVYIKLLNPLARLSITQTKGIIISPLGELFWYLSGRGDLNSIKYYLSKYTELADEDDKINGAYGPRLLNMHGSINQIETAIELLKNKPSTKRAVIQIYDAKDLINNKSKDIPCTCTLQFFIRDNKLQMFTHMRSNDAFIGMYHDIFCFTMIQEIVARTLEIELGVYNHFISSLHLYDSNAISAKQYLKEGYQSHKFLMPQMPKENLESNITEVIKMEEKIREFDETIDIPNLNLPDYWKDIVLFFKIFSLKKTNKQHLIPSVLNKISNKVFRDLVLEKYRIE
jgi:thymidylate synthase